MINLFRFYTVVILVLRCAKHQLEGKFINDQVSFYSIPRNRNGTTSAQYGDNINNNVDPLLILGTTTIKNLDNIISYNDDIVEGVSKSDDTSQNCRNWNIFLHITSQYKSDVSSIIDISAGPMTSVGMSVILTQRSFIQSPRSTDTLLRFISGEFLSSHPSLNNVTIVDIIPNYCYASLVNLLQDIAMVSKTKRITTSTTTTTTEDVFDILSLFDGLDSSGKSSVVDNFVSLVPLRVDISKLQSMSSAVNTNITGLNTFIYYLPFKRSDSSTNTIRRFMTDTGTYLLNRGLAAYTPEYKHGTDKADSQQNNRPAISNVNSITISIKGDNDADNKVDKGNKRRLVKSSILFIGNYTNVQSFEPSIGKGDDEAPKNGKPFYRDKLYQTSISLNRVALDVSGKGFHRSLSLTYHFNNTFTDHMVVRVSLLFVLPKEMYIDDDEIKRWNTAMYKQVNINNQESDINRVEVVPLHNNDIEKPSFMSSSSIFVINLDITQGSSISNTTTGFNNHNSVWTYSINIPIHLRYYRPLRQHEQQDYKSTSYRSTIQPANAHAAILSVPSVFVTSGLSDTSETSIVMRQANLYKFVGNSVFDFLEVSSFQRMPIDVQFVNRIIHQLNTFSMYTYNSDVSDVDCVSDEEFLCLIFPVGSLEDLLFAAVGSITAALIGIFGLLIIPIVFSAFHRFQFHAKAD